MMIFEAPLGGVWVSRIPLIFGQSILYPFNFCGLCPYNASYYWDVIARNFLDK